LKEVASVARQQAFNPGKKKARSTGSDFRLVDFTELTMSADYIYSAELVNTRYPRQTIEPVFYREFGDFTGNWGVQTADQRPQARHLTTANRLNITMQVDAAL
jgi:hypothetical protein